MGNKGSKTKRKSVNMRKKSEDHIKQILYNSGNILNDRTIEYNRSVFYIMV